MSELPRRPNDHLVEPMFAALDHHRGASEDAHVDSGASEGDPRAHGRARAGSGPTRRAPSTARVLFWIAIVCAAGATVWVTLAS